MSVIKTVLCGLLFLAIFVQPGFAQKKAADTKLPELYAKLARLHTPLPAPQPGDWLAEHKEPGQTFVQYRTSKYVKAVPARKTLYIQVLGEMTEKQTAIIGITREYMEIYFGLPVKILPAIPVNVIPAGAQRRHPEWGNHQLRTDYILKEVLYPRLPKDACAYIAFTAYDLYPGDGWNFVFGYAAYQARVGVWSIHRNGEPEKSDAEYRLCLKRTLRIATHETLHMFSMLHCTRWRCNLNGVNHLQEADATPLWLCPECLAKIKLATGVDLEKRFDGLIAFFEKHKLEEEAAFYKKEKAAFLKK